MNYLAKKIDSFVEFLEKDRLSIFGIFLWVLFISMIRGYIEPVLHYGHFDMGLFANDIFTGVSSFVGACILLSYFSKTSYRKVINVAAFGWIIFVSAPILDFLIFGTLDTGLWTFADMKEFSSPFHLIYPLFVIESGFSTGLVFQMILIYVLFSLYILWKMRSIKNVLLFLPVGFLFGFIQGIRPFFFYFINEIILEFKLLPAAYQWYFFLFVFWSGFVFLIKSRFRKEFYPFLRTPLFLGIVICSLGAMFSFPRFLNSWDLFLKVCVSVFLLTSFNIYIKNKISYKNFKTLFKSALFDSPKKDRKFLIFEISLCLQVISIVIAFLNSHLMESPVFIILTLFSVLIINLQEVFRNSIKNREFFYSILIPISFCLGYSVNSNNILDMVKGTWIFLTLLFVASLIIIYFSKR